ncbi:hypothetical protein FKW77_006002 [Venturia effusa]|uniref:Helicase C-terminal domain-containing protein n=1 Tax=Venturia effusa TaxID=50376 RepID=A0A517LKB6_9PEZI|nr:hypothetical protein FKW77_006002 [Venturia effusa]
MISLKRLLNDEEHIGQDPPFDFCNRDSFSEDPNLPDGSWSTLWSGLGFPESRFDSNDSALSSNGSGEVFYSQPIVSDIESWVSHEFPDENMSPSSDDIILDNPNADAIQKPLGNICYGMIYRTPVKLMGEMLSIDAKLKSNGRRRNESQQLLKLKKDDRGIILTFPDESDFGVLNNHASKALEDLIAWPSIQTDAHVEIRPLRETLGKATKAADAKTRVNIIFYGSAEDSEKFGRKLSKEKLYLQRPDAWRHGTTYENPHIIKFPDFQLTNPDLQQEEVANDTLPANSVLHFEKTISQVYASLKRGANLQRIEGDSRLRTHLLEHQEQGLDFMLQREDGPIEPAFSLWQPLSGEDEGWSRIEHAETGGGILADEMGMGKTLSILALITKTMIKAHDWASQKVADEADGELPMKKRTAATLVIVPSASHIVRRQATTFNRAVTEVAARSRWCLTGTPIQNRLADIGALFAFIRAHPFDSLATFKRYISVPFEESPERRATACHSLSLLLDSICLRRTKDLLHLPDRVDRLRELEFTEDERIQYEQTKRTMNRALRHRVGESFVKNRFGMFQVQLQLRILCNHGTFQHPFSWARRSLIDERDDAICTIGNLREVRCSACRQCMPVLESSNVYRTDNAHCGHTICAECLGDGIEQAYGCPLCLPGASLSGEKSRNEASVDGIQEEPYFQPHGHSSKMDALMADVRQDLDTTKSIIFSSWTNTLNLVGKYLNLEKIPFHRIDGNCALAARQKILDEFAESKDKPVLIMTTGTGAFGLNLTSANRIFIVEPQWNPSVENQAIARAQRLGQGQSVLVTRYKMKRTVEEEMRKQQEHKLSIAELGNATQSQNLTSQFNDEIMEDM